VSRTRRRLSSIHLSAMVRCSLWRMHGAWTRSASTSTPCDAPRRFLIDFGAARRAARAWSRYGARRPQNRRAGRARATAIIRTAGPREVAIHRGAQGRARSRDSAPQFEGTLLLSLGRCSPGLTAISLGREPPRGVARDTHGSSSMRPFTCAPRRVDDRTRTGYSELEFTVRISYGATFTLYTAVRILCSDARRTPVHILSRCRANLSLRRPPA
jgi:hypothetical protein